MIAVPDARAFELGFAPAAAAILSLGPQNTLLLRQGFSGRKALIVIGICYGCDLGLVLFGTLGLGAVVAALPIVSLVLRATGMGYLTIMALRCFARAAGCERAGLEGVFECAQRVILAALMVSVFNPLAWVESVLVLGAISSTVECNLAIVVAAGASMGTLCRLSVLGLGGRVLRPMFRWPAFRRAFDTLAGVVMAGMAIVLLMGLVFCAGSIPGMTARDSLSPQFLHKLGLRNCGQ